MNRNIQKENEQIVLNFLKALENRKSSIELSDFYHEEIQQIEYPNLLLKSKTIRTLKEIIAASEKGLMVITREHYEVLSLYSYEDMVIIEALWEGTLALPIGYLNVGDKMIAHFAQFFQLKDGKIIKQRNYDCFEHF